MSDTAETDEAESAAWMQALQAGEDAVLADLIARWQGPLLRFVFRYVQSETEAREIVHETFVRVHAQRAKFRAGQPFRPWLLTIAANLARNRRRWWRRHPSLAWLSPGLVQPAHDDTPCPAATPEEAALRAERVQAVQAALKALPHDWKVALLLHEYEDMGYREIAAVLGCSERGVEARLTRARERMRAALAAYLQAGDDVAPRRRPAPSTF
jgi:RNA polymerase sigma-70 factor (ECF subfamily)